MVEISSEEEQEELFSQKIEISHGGQRGAFVSSTLTRTTKRAATHQEEDQLQEDGQLQETRKQTEEFKRQDRSMSGANMDTTISSGSQEDSVCEFEQSGESKMDNQQPEVSPGGKTVQVMTPRQKQFFVRCASGRRSSRRSTRSRNSSRRSRARQSALKGPSRVGAQQQQAAPTRQVRFQPIPQAINVSIVNYSNSTNNDDSNQCQQQSSNQDHYDPMNEAFMLSYSQAADEEPSSLGPNANNRLDYASDKNFQQASNSFREFDDSPKKHRFVDYSSMSNSCSLGRQNGASQAGCFEQSRETGTTFSFSSTKRQQTKPASKKFNHYHKISSRVQQQIRNKLSKNGAKLFASQKGKDQETGASWRGDTMRQDSSQESNTVARNGALGGQPVTLSTRPTYLAKKFHNLSSNTIKLSNKIKLRTSINMFASQLHSKFQPSATSSTNGSSFGPAKTPSNSRQFYSFETTSSANKQRATVYGNCHPQQQQQQQQQQMHQFQHNSNATDEGPEDFGWGSDFDEQSSLDSTASEAQAKHQEGYLLEIGKSSCDQRAVCDIIQDQGISGQFKRLAETPVKARHSADCYSTGEACYSAAEAHYPASEAATKTGSRQVELQARQEEPRLVQERPEESELELEATEEEDEEAELRSLEARQGFKQVRDKLKLFLDARLAAYERQQCAQGATCPPLGQAERQSQLSQQKMGQPPSQSGVCLQDGGAIVGPNNGQHCADLHQPRGAANIALDNMGEQQELSAANSANHDHRHCHRQRQEHQQQQQEDSCNDETSSLTSGSLAESNHTGSQDSGHSTQHSTYSAIGHCANSAVASRRATASSASTAQELRVDAPDSSEHHEGGPHKLSRQNESPQMSSSSPSSGMGSLSPVDHHQHSSGHQTGASSSSCSSSEHLKAPVHIIGPKSSSNSDNSSNCDNGHFIDEERRSRFLQNRLIINNKLESMFKSRSSSHLMVSNALKASPTKSVQECPNVCTTSASPKHSPDNKHQLSPVKKLQLFQGLNQPRPMSTTSSICSSSCGSTATTNSSQITASNNYHLDHATRMQLLEQQRLMSLKLKQKPRRKTARRALELQQAQHLNDTTAPSSSRNNDQMGQTHGPQSNHLDPQQSIAEQNSAMTKQVSLVCLRQLEQGNAGRRDQVESDDSRAASGQQQGMANRPPLAALSLRQLVKNTIDERERPSKLSTLTRNALQRSDSLSSSSAISGEHEGAEEGERHHLVAQQEAEKGDGANEDAYDTTSSDLNLSLVAQDQSRMMRHSSPLVGASYDDSMIRDKQRFLNDYNFSFSSSTAKEVEDEPMERLNSHQLYNRRQSLLVLPSNCYPIMPFQHQPTITNHTLAVSNSMSSVDSSTIDGLEYLISHQSSLEATQSGERGHEQQTNEKHKSLGSYLLKFKSLGVQYLRLPKAKLQTASN